MYNNNQNYSSRAQGQGRKETPVNKVELTGTVRPRGNYQEIRVNQLPSGGASVRFALECREYTGQSDENGNPKVRTTFVPVSVWSNKIISAAKLATIQAGMKVHVIGRWSNQHYKDKTTNLDKYFTECEAYVLDIQDMPQAYQPQMPPQGPAQYGPQPAPQYAPQYAPQQGYQGAYQPQYGPQQAPPAYGQQPVPGFGQQQMPPQYSRPGQGQQQPAAPQYAPQQGQAQVPPYYQRPGQGQQQPAAAAAGQMDIEDLPDAIAQ